MEILGRDGELGLVEDWLTAGGAARAGEASLVIEGEPGIGKTTLWAEAVRRARQRVWQVHSCRPAPSDTGLPYAGLTDLLRSVPDRAFAGLPPPQRRPLLVALLREDAGEGDLDPRAVGTGLTALLGTLAGDGSLMLAVDDVQWLDPASERALGFALRRLAERLVERPVRLLAAARTEGPAGIPPPGSGGGAGGAGASAPPGTAALPGLAGALDRGQVRRLPVGPLTVAAIHQMFRRVLGTSFPRPVLLRIHRAAGGNPFYALEIAREVQRLGVPPPGQPLPVPGDHRELALLRLRRLPRATREALAVVAAVSHPAATALDPAALAPARQAGIVRVQPGGRAEFTHPLYGSALYSSLPEAERRALHRDLAGRAATVAERAHHLALAADGPDEGTARVLDHASDEAAARGAAALAAELSELARRLTPPGDQRAVVRRDLQLAGRRYFAGDPAGARAGLERSLACLPPGGDRAEVLLELGSVRWAQGEAGEGRELMFQALGEAPTPALRARIHSRISALSDDCDIAAEHAEAALALLDPARDPLLYSFALHNAARWKLFAGRGADHEAIKRGMALQHEAASWEVSTVPAYWARDFDDFGLARERFEALLRMFRDRGDEASCCGVLAHLAVIDALTGHMDRAAALAAEALDLAGQTEQETYINVALWAGGQVYARAGDVARARAAGEEILRRLSEAPDIALEGMASAVLGLAALAAGDLAEADARFTRADEVCESLHAREPAAERFHADHAEVVIELGDLDRAQRLADRMRARATALPRPWISAVSARTAGLLHAARGELDAAMASYEQAMAAHQGLDMPAELGRTLLAVGRLHRRRNERQRAGRCLAEAQRAFEAAGAAGWAAVAAGELRRTQGRGGGRELTATERRIAELAVSGLRNHEIAARLFLSAKTVEANLTRAYRKLGIRSRAELASRLGTPSPQRPA